MSETTQIIDRAATVERWRATIPQELQALDQWVTWYVGERDGKPTKIPYSFVKGRDAKSNDPATWGNFEKACASFERAKKPAGIGFMFSEHDPYSGVDFDKCVTDGVIDPTRAAWVAQLDSYAEFSPSGAGIHVIVKGTLPPAGRKNRTLNVEMYDRLRFFTFTGYHIPTAPATVNERQSQLDSLHSELFPTKDKPKPTPGHTSANGAVPTDDQALLGLMFASKPGPKIERLWNGDINGYAGDDSGADQALCNYLAFWTGKDAAPHSDVGAYLICKACWQAAQRSNAGAARLLAGMDAYLNGEAQP